MSAARLMTFEEVEKCEGAWLIYDPDDPEAHYFIRVKNIDSSIIFHRKLKNHVSCQPCLFKDLYDKKWVAFASKPEFYQVTITKRRLYDGKDRI